MRVISGSARGTRLAAVPAGTRPLSDRAREGLFASLGDLVVEARCLDLFAGTGAVGIEALSRGATSCLFVDRGAAAVRTIRANLERTGLDREARVVRGDVRRTLERERGRFDLAFLDPPYSHPAAPLAIVLGKTVERLEPGGLLALTGPRKDRNDVIPVDWSAVKRLVYGDTLVLLLREEA
jgi:16S rRNA (guanine966-N2)-methyltransferase